MIEEPILLQYIPRRRYVKFVNGNTTHTYFHFGWMSGFDRFEKRLLREERKKWWIGTTSTWRYRNNRLEGVEIRPVTC